MHPEQLLQALEQERKSLDGVVNAGCAEKDNLLVHRQTEGAACGSGFVEREFGGRKRVGNNRDGLVAQQGTLLHLLAEPLADRYHVEWRVAEDALLLPEYAGGQVVAARQAQKRAVMTLRLVAAALVGMMTDGCTLPHVVKGPYHRLAGLHDAVYFTQREHALVNPVQMNDVSLPESWQAGDVLARVGD